MPSPSPPTREEIVEEYRQQQAERLDDPGEEATEPRNTTPPDTAAATPAPTPEPAPAPTAGRTYDTVAEQAAYDFCSDPSVFEAYGTTDHAEIAEAYGEAVSPDVRLAAELACLEGLQDAE